MPISKVTVGIPTFNRAAYLEQAIRSALAQTHSNVEIIVSDNASTDATGNLLGRTTDPRIVVIAQSENLGMVGNWNACLGRATGEYFLLLSDDDVLEPDAIATLLQGFSSENVMLSYGQVQNIDPAGNTVPTKTFSAPPIEAGEQFCLGVLGRKRAAFPSATLFRTSDARGVHAYPDIGTASDFGLHYLLAMQGRIHFRRKVVAKYRVHAEAESLSRRAVSSQLSMVHWMRSIPAPEKHRRVLRKFSEWMVFESGRHHALRGNAAELEHALSILQQINPHSRKATLLRFLNRPVMRQLAALRRSMRST